MRALTIAIDGPSGAGKGTVARAVAAALGYRHIDSGAMYRVVGWKAVQARVALEDEPSVARIAEAARIEIVPAGVFIDGVDVTRAIRTPEIDRAAAAVARLPRVRAELVARQRAMGADGGIVMEGRDIGTVVFPGADVKIYLDASTGGTRPAPRARSRALGRPDGCRRSGHGADRARRARSHARGVAALRRPRRHRHRHDGKAGCAGGRGSVAVCVEKRSGLARASSA